ELDELIKLYPTLGEAYRLKVLFNDLWEMPDKPTVLSQIFIKCKAALICGHSYPAKAINCL
ncbi:MAG TPA: hypothetical protein VIJ25_04070, partial [Methylococcales bacterium]